MRPLDDLWNKVKKPPDLTDCWEWLGPWGWGGYGRFRTRYAHRVAYELTHGPIPKGLVIDHLCRHRWCVNPSHLRVVTIAENVTAPGSQTGAHEGRKTHCYRGHEFTPENTYRHPRLSGRHCKTCRRLSDKTHPRARRKHDPLPELPEHTIEPT